MMTIIDVLEQDRLWMAADRRLMRLDDMDSHHRYNTLAMLRRRASQLQEHALWLELRYSQPSHNARELLASPVDWLESRPLILRLQQLVNRDGSIDGEVVDDKLEELDSE